ncbi:MAG: hypothetical protein DRP71_09425 [Verrucomicrobia bacterium]|nr:MAG: hypothetical protein DRP71_09425 [Verrucomicrobiota bacterium]
MPESPHPIAARRPSWQDSLTAIQSEPLSFCPSFPEIAEKWNNWWACRSGQPLIVAQVAKTDTIRWDKAFDLLEQPEEWLSARRKQVEETYHAGEAIPSVRVDFGPVALAAFMGAPLHFAQEEQTTWQDPVVESWEDENPMRVDPDNRWLKQTLLLMEILAGDARGNYLVCLPDLTGAIDAIANMRTPTKLCFDLYENRDAVLAATMRSVDAWETVFARMYDLVLGHGAGIIQWVTSWADSPYTLPTCDFNALIGRQDFDQVCMPSLKEQARRAGLCVFHLDGPDAARHAETLAKDPDITAVQFTAGAGTPSALAKVEMFRMIQQHATPLFIECPAEEVRELAQTLDPHGVAYRVLDLKSPKEADELVAWRDRTFN